MLDVNYGQWDHIAVIHVRSLSFFSYLSPHSTTLGYFQPLIYLIFCSCFAVSHVPSFSPTLCTITPLFFHGDDTSGPYFGIPCTRYYYVHDFTYVPPSHVLHAGLSLRISALHTFSFPLVLFCRLRPRVPFIVAALLLSFSRTGSVSSSLTRATVLCTSPMYYTTSTSAFYSASKVSEWLIPVLQLLRTA